MLTLDFKMKFLLMVIVAIGLTLAEASVGDILDEYDWIGVAKDEKEFQRVLTCLAQDVPCDNLQKLKENGIKLFKSNCGDCTPSQKEKFEQYKAYMLEAHPKEYEVMLKVISESP